MADGKYSVILDDDEEEQESPYSLVLDDDEEEDASPTSYADSLRSGLDALYSSGKGLYQGLENAARNAELSLLRSGELGLNSIGISTPASLRKIREQEKEQATKELLGDDKIANTVSGLTEGIAPAIGLGVATGGAVLPSAILAGQSALERYTQSRDRGASYPQGIAEGGLVGSLDYIANRVMLNTPIMGKGSVGGRLFRNTVEGAGGGVVSESGRVGADIIAGERPTGDEVTDRLLEAGGKGAVVSLAIGGGIEGARAAGARSLKTRLDSTQEEWARKLDELGFDRTTPIDTPPGGGSDGGGGGAIRLEDVPIAKTDSSPGITVDPLALPEPKSQGEFNSPIQDIEINKNEAPKTSNVIEKAKVGDGDTILLDPLQLSLSKDVPQFKEESQPIQDKFRFNPKEQNPIAVWERNDGTLEVISGRHRWEKAAKDIASDLQEGKDVSGLGILANVYKESDGFTVKDARLLDVVSNIRDGQGSAKDYARFFDANPMSPDQVNQQGFAKGRTSESTGLALENKGVQGYEISAYGTRPLKDLFFNDKISANKAAAIANSIPNNEGLQRYGLELALRQNKSAQELGTILRNLADNTDILAKQTQGSQDSQGAFDFFDNDPAIKEAVRLGTLASKLQSEITNELKLASDVNRRKEYASKVGINIKDPAAFEQKRLELRDRVEKLSNYSKHPEVLQELRDRIRAEEFQAQEALKSKKEPTANVAKNEFDSPVSKQDDIFTEPIPFRARIEPDGEVRVVVDEPGFIQRDAERKSIEGEVSKFTNLTKKQRSQAGMVFNPFRRKVVGNEVTDDTREYVTPNSAMSTGKRVIERMRTTAEKYKDDLGGYFETRTVKMPNAMRTVAIDLMDNLHPYAKLTKAERYKIDGLIFEARKRGRTLELPELKFLGLNDRLAQGVLAANKTMDRALDHLMDGELAQIANDPKMTIQEKHAAAKDMQVYFESLRKKGYVPHMRTGNYLVAARDAEGKLKYYAFAQTEKDANRLASETRRRTGLKVSANIRPDVVDSKDATTRMLPGDMAPFLSSIKGKTARGSFADNFLEAELIPGQDVDLLPSLEKYIAGAARHYADAMYGHTIQNTLEKLSKEKKFGLKAMVTQFEDRLSSPDVATEFMAENIAPLLNLRTLTSNGMNLLANVLEPINVYAQSTRYLKATGTYAPGKAEYLAAKSAFDMFAQNVGLSPDVKAGFEWGKANGFMDDTKIRELFERNNTEQASPMAAIKELNQFLGTPNRKVEDFVKSYTYTMGINIGKQAGYKGDALYEFAQNFTQDIKSSGSPIEQNQLYGKVPVIAHWRNYSGNMLRMLGRNLREADYESLAKTLGLSGLVIGGVFNVLPFQNMFQSFLELDGRDPKQVIRELVKNPDMSDLLIYGLPGQLGLDFTRNLGFGNFVSTNEKAGLLENIANVALGTVASPYNDFRRSYDAFRAGDYSRGIRFALPQYLRQFQTSAAMDKEGITDATGNYIYAPGQADKKTQKAAMFNLKTLESAKNYEFNNSIRVGDVNEAEQKSILKKNLINSIRDKDTEKTKRMIQDPRVIEMLANPRTLKDIVAKTRGGSSIERTLRSLGANPKKIGKAADIYRNMFNSEARPKPDS